MQSIISVKFTLLKGKTCADMHRKTMTSEKVNKYVFKHTL